MDRAELDCSELQARNREAIRNDPDVPGIYTALDEQLGLTLQPITADIDVLVIESVTMPTPD